MLTLLIAAAAIALIIVGLVLMTRRRPRRSCRAPGKLLHPLPIYWIENLISAEERDQLLALGKPLLGRSKVEGSRESPDRTSSTAYLPDNPLTAKIRERAARLVNYPVNKVEQLQLVCYQPGQQYKPHHDYLSHRNSRHVTFFVYLDDSDGATEFPRLGLKIQPKPLCAAMWYNVDPSGKPNPDTLHAGRPPTREKYGINIWIDG